MRTTQQPWKTILIWGLAVVAVLMLGAVIDNSGVSGTCMFILVPYFAAICGVFPVLALNRMGTGVLVFVPYALIGFAPLYYFDYLQTHQLVGLWAVFAFSASGPLIGAALDLANLLTARYGERTRAICMGAAMQAMTFVVTLLGLRYLYVPTSAMAGHVLFYTREWYFTLPWMAVNGAFGGYTAYTLKKRA